MNDRRLGVMAIVALAVLAVLTLNLVVGRDPLVTNALRLAVTALFWGIWAIAGAVLLVIAWLAPRRAIRLIERGRVARR